MPIEEMRETDFSGGIRASVGAGEAAETQWLDLTGFVLDNDRRLRAQWPALTQPVVTPPGELGRGGEFIAGVSTSTHLAASLVDANGAPTGWTLVAVPAGVGTGHRPLCPIPVAVGTETVTGLLFNAPDTVSKPFVLYRTGGAWATKTWTANYPSGTPTKNAMPVGAGVATTWGDYLVLADVQWLANDSLAFSASNTKRLVNAMWFSQPGEFEDWDPIDVQFAGYKSSQTGQNQIVGLFTVEQGLLVFTTDHIALLRGTPNKHVYEELVRGISPQSVRHVARWPATGSIAWVDALGHVWQTNGETWVRLDRQVEAGTGLAGAAPAQVSITAVADYLVVSSPDACWTLTSYGPEGAWTRLAYPDPAVLGSRWSNLFATSSTLYATSTVTGLVRMPVAGLGANRGTIDGTVKLQSRLATRSLPGGGHDRIFWHRHGVRAVGSGRLLSATAFPTPDGTGVGFAADGLPVQLSVRGDVVAPAHGPSLEATFVYEFEGDVTLEGVSVWFHKGRAQR
jgi:hypothetical protein